MSNLTRVVAGVSLALASAVPTLAATRVTIHALQEHPEAYYNQTVRLECYYDKESPIWVRALPDADEWIGMFVTGEPEKALTWSGEYYNLVFAPRLLQEQVRALRDGDKIALIGEAFHYRSQSLDGVGLHVQQILRGWGSAAKAIGAPAASSQMATAAEAPRPTMPAAAAGIPRPTEPAEKYAVIINGKRYEGLRVGDRYNFEGVDFQVDRPQEKEVGP